MYCENCGASLKETAKFCDQCGASVKAGEEVKKYCKNCQAQLEPDGVDSGSNVLRRRYLDGGREQLDGFCRGIFTYWSNRNDSMADSCIPFCNYKKLSESSPERKGSAETTSFGKTGRFFGDFWLSIGVFCTACAGFCMFIFVTGEAGERDSSLSPRKKAGRSCRRPEAVMIETVQRTSGRRKHNGEIKGRCPA